MLTGRSVHSLVGERLGIVRYFLNTGNASSPVYVEQSGGYNPFHGVDVGYLAAPWCVDMDADGDMDWCGAFDG